MGPPLKAAENPLVGRSPANSVSRFNGAAAKSSGKSVRGHDHERLGADASMGPPLKAAENRAGTRYALTRFRGFNGAAAKSSGKSASRAASASATNWLQWGRR